MERPRVDKVSGYSSYAPKTFEMPLSTTQLHSLCPFSSLLKLSPDQIQTHTQKTGGVQKHDYTVQIKAAAVCLIYTLMISSPSNKSIANYLWMCSFV